MISRFLLSLALGVAAHPVARPAVAPSDDPAIRIWLNEDGRFQRGDRAEVQVRTRDDGYLLVLHLDPDNRLRVLFPLDPEDDNFVRGGKKYQILGRGERETFEVDIRSGRGTVYAAVSRDPYRWDRLVVGDHWDFRALNEVPLTRDVEADLTEFVRELATADFDYDYMDYDVYERIYASGTTHYATIYHGSSYWDPYYSPWCASYWGCGRSGLFIGIGFGGYGWYDPWPYYGYGHYAYYPYHYPFYRYPYYRYPAYYPYRPFHPYRPFYPYRYRDPYRYRGAGTYYAGGYYFGGHYTAPWRNRTNDRFYSTGFAWRGREATTDLAQAGRLTTGFRDRVSDRGSLTGGRLAGGRPTDVTPRRRGAERPAPNLNPVRTEGRRPAATVPNPVRVGADAEPREPRRVEGRPSDGGRRLGEGREVRETQGMREVRERTAAEPRRRDFIDRDSEDRGRGYETGIIDARRERPQFEPRRTEPRAEPRPEPRSQPRAEPRAEPRPQPRSQPRMEPRSSPRAEPRSAPRGDHGSAGRGGRPRGRS
jgi:hypothetical protein